ncbi:MAG: DUF3783 domain-containing protein [Gallintestinimicrobium sp.]
MKLIYFDAGNPQKKKELEGLAKTAGYDFVPVAAMQTGQKIGYLAGVSGYRETPLPVLALPPRIGEDMLLFAQTTADMIDPALELLKKNRISIALKAIVTPYNIGWTLWNCIRSL